MKTYPFYKFSVGDIICYGGGTVWKVLGYDIGMLRHHEMYVLEAIKVGADHENLILPGHVTSALSSMIDQIYELVEYVSVNENI